MNNLVFIKLGGSLITDKQQRYHAREATIRRLAQEIARARAASPSLQLLIGHGSGSFGHIAAKETGYDRQTGHQSALAFARVGAAASALNSIIRAELLAAEVPVLSLPPSASARLEDGSLVDMALGPFVDLLAQGIVPLVYGDVVLYANGQGSGIASTEMVFRLLAQTLRPRRILLLGLVEGVFAAPPPLRNGEWASGRVDTTTTAVAPSEAALPALLPEITQQNWEDVRIGLGGSHGTDVTGGMINKVAEILSLIKSVPTLQARIVTGEQPGLLEKLLLEPTLRVGTLIHRGIK
jgi:isopentenyl phosphate kinase